MTNATCNRCGHYDLMDCLWHAHECLLRQLAAKDAVIMALADRILTAHEVLSHLAERRGWVESAVTFDRPADSEGLPC